MFQVIHLAICKAIHGSFSSKYFFLVQKYREKYPKLNITLKKCFGTEAILKFENLIVRNNRFPVYKTLHPIHFEKIEFGSDLKVELREKGGVNCVNYLLIGEDTIRVSGYSEHILNVPAILLFFFCDGKYFMGEYFFSEKHKGVPDQLAKTIFKRYNIEAVGDEMEFYIEDEKGSVLCFCDNGFSLSIKYFNPAFCHSFDRLQSLYQRKFADIQDQSPDIKKQIPEIKI